MKRGILLGTMLLALLSLRAQSGYQIEASVEGFAGDTAYLAYYLGDKTYLQDTVPASNGAFVFAGEERLDGGIYLVVLPPENNYFELIVDADQHFKVKTKAGNFIPAMQVIGSEDNRLFYEDMQFLGEKRQAAQALQEQIKTAGEGEKAALEQKMTEINEEVMAHRRQFQQQHPDLLYTKILQALEEPTVPEAPTDMADSLVQRYQFLQYRKHYFDKIDFGDERLLRTPVMVQKVDQYLEKLTVKHPDSISHAVDEVVSRARANDEVFKYFVVNLLNKYAKSKLMGMDAVYVHMVEQYYLSGDAYWTDSTTLAKMEERALALSPNLIGRVAPNFVAYDVNNNPRSLHGVEAPYTILYFWDYDCSHCKTVTPRLGKAFPRYAEKGVALFAVSINGDVDIWKEKIKTYGLETALNVQDHYRRSGFQDLYDIRSTPRLFLLDKDKKIMAKQITVQQMEEILSRELGLEVPESEEEEEEVER
jgi:peroxiredoxin